MVVTRVVVIVVTRVVATVVAIVVTMVVTAVVELFIYSFYLFIVEGCIAVSSLTCLDSVAIVHR